MRKKNDLSNLFTISSLWNIRIFNEKECSRCNGINVTKKERKKKKKRKLDSVGRVTKEVANSLISCRSTTPLFPTIHISFHLKQRPIKRKKNNRLFHVSNLLLFFCFCRRFSDSVEKDIQLLCDTKERREIDICGFSISFSRFKSSTLQLQNKQREEIFENE